MREGYSKQLKNNPASKNLVRRSAMHNLWENCEGMKCKNLQKNILFELEMAPLTTLLIIHLQVYANSVRIPPDVKFQTS